MGKWQNPWIVLLLCSHSRHADPEVLFACKLGTTSIGMAKHQYFFHLIASIDSHPVALFRAPNPYWVSQKQKWTIIYGIQKAEFLGFGFFFGK